MKNFTKNKIIIFFGIILAIIFLRMRSFIQAPVMLPLAYLGQLHIIVLIGLRANIEL